MTQRRALRALAVAVAVAVVAILSPRPAGAPAPTLLPAQAALVTSADEAPPPSPPTTTTSTTAAPAPPRTTTTRASRSGTRHAPPPVTAPPAQSTGGLPAGLLCIRHWESHDNYSDNTGNGYYGAYQYTIRTWNHYGGFARADLAPPSTQDARALSDYNRGAAQRRQNWPTTSVRCGVG